MTLLEKSGLNDEVIESNTLVEVRTYHLQVAISFQSDGPLSSAQYKRCGCCDKLGISTVEEAAANIYWPHMLTFKETNQTKILT